LFKDLKVRSGNDYDEIRRQLWVLRMLMSRGDYDFAEKRVLELRAFLDSYFAKEESRMSEANTVSRSHSYSENKRVIAFHKEQFIESLIRKRKEASDSFSEIQNLTGFSSDMERFSCFDKFERTLLNCLSQETSGVMPVPLETNKHERRTIVHEERKPQDLVLMT
jgi:hypothetical protein